MWYKRQSRTKGYHVAIALWFSAAFWALIAVPYIYDQQNRKQYEQAISQGNLVIHEFGEIYRVRILEECKVNDSSFCTQAGLFSALKDKQIIALDYVSNLEAAGKLTSWEFWRVCVVGYFIMIIAVLTTSIKTTKHNNRFMLLLSILIVGILLLHFAVNLPHKNIKFYYIVGSIFSMLLPLMDYFHNVPKIGTDGELGREKLFALQEIHKRWTTVLNISLAIVITFFGTVSFNIVDYHARVFGESFMFYPLIGVVAVGVFSIAGFLWGILRNLVSILSEIEFEISNIEIEPKIEPTKPVATA